MKKEKEAQSSDNQLVNKIGIILIISAIVIVGILVVGRNFNTAKAECVDENIVQQINEYNSLVGNLSKGNCGEGITCLENALQKTKEAISKNKGLQGIAKVNYSHAILCGFDEKVFEQAQELLENEKRIECNIEENRFNEKVREASNAIELLNKLNISSLDLSIGGDVGKRLEVLAAIKATQEKAGGLSKYIEENEETLGKCGAEIVKWTKYALESSQKLGALEQSIAELRTNQEIKIQVEELPAWADKKYLNAVQEAFVYWKEKANATFVESIGGSVRAEWVKDFGKHNVGSATENLAVLGLGDSSCKNEWKPFAYETVKLIAIHELGHVIGFPHTNDSSSVMNPIIKTHYEYDAKEESVVPAGYLWFYGVCTPEASATYDLNIISNNFIDVLGVPSYEEFQKMSEGNDYKKIDECKEDFTTSFGKKCVIPKGGGIVVSNARNKIASQATIRISEVLQN